MIELLWVSVAAVALMIWAYRHRPLRANDLGSVSSRWLQGYRNDTHQDR